MVTNFPVVEDAKVVTKYTDYNVNTPDFFINFLQKELPLRDVRGLTNGRITGINVTGEHPLVLMTGAVLSAQKSIDITGMLPAISVIESDENEEFETLGYSKRIGFVIDTAWVSDFETNHGDIKTRMDDGLLSDNQLAKIKQAVANAGTVLDVNGNTTVDETGKPVVNPLNPNGAIVAYLDGHMIRESIFVSLWVESVEERNIVGNTLRSVIYDMRKEMVNKDLKDIHIKSSKGLVNSNFGRILKGQETSIDFINVFHTITVTNDIPVENLLDSTNNIQIYDTMQEAFIEISTNLDVNNIYNSVATSDNSVDSAGNEIS